MNTSRPVNLALGSFKWPVTAIASILHRVSAVTIWLGFFFMLVLGYKATASQEGFQAVSDLLASHFLIQFFSWGFLTALGYYCAATVKHVVQDLGYFESFEAGKTISWTAIGIGLVLSVVAGVIVWG